MAKTLRPEHYRRRGFDWQKSQWPQPQTLFQRCLPHAFDLLSLANTLSWRTADTHPDWSSDTGESITQIHSEQEREERFEEGLQAIMAKLDELGIPYEYLENPLTEREVLKNNFEPFYISFSRCRSAGRRWSGHLRGITWIEVDFTYLDDTRMLYMGRINGGWKMQKDLIHWPEWKVYDTEQPVSATSSFTLQWYPYNGVLYFPKRPQMPPRTLNYP